MKILYVIDGLTYGGKERQLVEIIKLLSNKKKHKIGVITFNINQHYSSIVEQNVDFYKVHIKRPTRLEPFFTIWKSIILFRPDIIHTWDSISSFYSYLPCKLLRLKYIDGSIRDAGVDKGWLKIFKLFFLKRANLIISNSFAGLKAYNVQGYVVYNAIDEDRFKLQENNKQYNVVMTANFSDYKDHQTFIDACIKLVNDEIIDNVFLLGDGPLRLKYIDFLKKNHTIIYNKFHFPGAVYNVESYLAKCRIGVLCSTPEYSEGLSNAVLEYIAAGLIPIVTNLGGSSEIIKNRKEGFLIPPKDSNAIITIVKEIKSNNTLYEEIKLQSHKTLHSKFNSKMNVKYLESIYNKLCQ